MPKPITTAVAKHIVGDVITDLANAKRRGQGDSGMEFPTEYSRVEVHGFDVVASTHTQPGYWQGDFISLGRNGESRLLTPSQAIEVATALIAAVNATQAAAKVPA